MSHPEYEVECPMPDCTETLYVNWILSYALSPNDLIGGGLSSDRHHSCTFQIECGNGHVILLPGDTGCPCEDQDGADCAHGRTDEYDWYEENRTLRSHDMDRLRSLIAVFAPVGTS